MSSTAVAQHPAVERQPRSVMISMADRYGMEPAAFEATLRATVVPKETTREQLAAFLLVAKEYNLNPVLKEIYAFPTRGGGIQPIVSVDGWSNLINSHAQCDGVEFDDHLAQDGSLTAITCRIYRKDRGRAIAATEYMAECRRNTDTWKQWPRRMLRHKALIQAARYAFGFSGIYDPDEAERAITETAEPAPAITAESIRAAAPSPSPVITDAEFIETPAGAVGGAPATSPATETSEAEQAPADDDGWASWLSVRKAQIEAATTVLDMDAVKTAATQMFDDDPAPEWVRLEFNDAWTKRMKLILAPKAKK